MYLQHIHINLPQLKGFGGLSRKGRQATAMRFIGAVIEAATIKAPFSWSFNQLKDKQMRSTWNSKQPVFNECFNWMIPNHCIKNGCLTKHPLKTGCLEFQEER